MIASTLLWINEFGRDLRLAIRSVAKDRVFFVVSVATLAIGIGCVTASFSFIDALLFRDLPVPKPGELRIITWSGDLPSRIKGQSGRNIPPLSYPIYRDIHDQFRGIADVFGFYLVRDVTAINEGMASTANGLMVSKNFFRAYGGTALLGRLLYDGEQAVDQNSVIISHRWWVREFHKSENVIGQSVLLNGKAFTIVGVLPNDFVSPESGDPADFYVNIKAQPSILPAFPLGSEEFWWIEVMARLPKGANEKAFSSKLAVIFQSEMMSLVPKDVRNVSVELLDGSRGYQGVQKRLANSFTLPGIAAATVIFIICVNIGGLLVARSLAREQEFMVRRSLGATRFRIFRQVLAEGLLLVLIGACLGSVVAQFAKSVLFQIISPSSINTYLDVHNDSNVLILYLVVVGLLATFFAVCSSFQLWKGDELCYINTRGGVYTRSSAYLFAKCLVIIQAAATTAIILVSLLFLNSLWRLYHVELGFNPKEMLVFRLGSGATSYTKEAPAGQSIKRIEEFRSVREHIASLPGVLSVTMSDFALIDGGRIRGEVTIPDRQSNPDEDIINALTVDAGFFETMGIRLLTGRIYQNDDRESKGNPVVVNEAFVRKYFPNRTALGEIIHTDFTGADSVARHIIGIVGDVKIENLRDAVPPTVFLPFGHSNVGGMYFGVKSVLPASFLEPSIRKIVANLLPSSPIGNFAYQEDRIERSIAPEKLSAQLYGSLTLLAIVLSAMGVYGLASLLVGRSLREMALRIALGATSNDLIKRIVGNILLLVLIGIFFGIFGGVTLSNIVAVNIYGFRSVGPIQVELASTLVILIVFVAAWMPARRISSIDPIVSLRSE